MQLFSEYCFLVIEHLWIGALQNAVNIIFCSIWNLLENINYAIKLLSKRSVSQTLMKMKETITTSPVTVCIHTSRISAYWMANDSVGYSSMNIWYIRIANFEKSKNFDERNSCETLHNFAVRINQFESNMNREASQARNSNMQILWNVRIKRKNQHCGLSSIIYSEK